VRLATWFCLILLPQLWGRHPINLKQYGEDLRQLSSAKMAGRATGSAGLEQAGSFIAQRFASAGLLPPAGRDYCQPFQVAIESRLGQRNELAVRRAGQSQQPLSLYDEFLPVSASSTAQFRGTVVFAGFGISAPEYGYDDYAGIDVRGKAVLILRHEPGEHDGESPFEGRVYTEHSQVISKARAAKARGAAVVLVVNDTEQHGGGDTLEPFSTLPGPAAIGVAYVQVKADVVRGWFGDPEAFAEVQNSIDTTGRPHSFTLPGIEIELRTEVDQVQKQVCNIAAFLPGQTDEYVVIGAHYDHVGLGEQYSMSPSSAGTVHPGADDNASGVAALLGIADWVASRPKPRRGFLFLAFAGEELGLLGSSHYVNHPLLPLQSAVAMLNMDMIGRLRDRKLVVGGSRSGSTLNAILARSEKKHHLELDTSELAVYGSSDHTSFKTRMIPVLFFFTGLHSDYHRPTDTADKIDFRMAAAVAAFVADVTWELASDPERAEFQVAKPRERATIAGGGGGAR
jgi:hypothetical protein